MIGTFYVFKFKFLFFLNTKRKFDQFIFLK